MNQTEVDYKLIYEDARGKEIIHREIRKSMIEPFTPDRIEYYLENPTKLEEEIKKANEFFINKYNRVESLLREYEPEVAENEESDITETFRKAEKYLRNLEYAKSYIEFFEAKIKNYMSIYKNITDSKNTIEKRKQNKRDDRDRSEKNFKKITKGMRKLSDSIFMKIGTGTASGLTLYYYLFDQLPISENMKNSLSLTISAVVAVLTKPVMDYVIDKIENRRIDKIYRNYEYGMRPLREEEMKLNQRLETDIKRMQEELFYKIGEYFPGSVKQLKYIRENGKTKIEESVIRIEPEETSLLKFMDDYEGGGII